MKRNSAHIWIIILLLTVVTAIYTAWGNTALTVTEITVNDSRIPQGFDGFTIVQVSDLHNAVFGSNNGQLTAAVKKCSPDIIVITGDLIDYRNGSADIGIELAGSLDKIAPTYFVSGNHENDRKNYNEIAADLKDEGVYVMRGESLPIAIGDDTIYLLGIDDPVLLPKDKGSANGERIGAAIADIMPQDGYYTVLLAHRPEYIDIYEEQEVSLVFSGHAHGGQFIIPFIGGLYAPGQGIFPQYTEGMYTLGETHMIVSRGLGNSGFPFRINNRPEIVCVRLEAADPEE